MTTDTRVGLALAVALPAQLLTWTQVTRHTAALQAAAATMLVVLLIGWVARRLRLSAPVVIGAQAVAWAAATVGSVGVLHGGVALAGLPSLPAAGISFLQDSSAPLAPNAAATLILVGLAGLLALAADALAVTGRWPALAVVPLLGLHLVMALGLSTPTLFGEFVLLAAGIALVLLAASPQVASGRAATRLAAWLTVAAMTAGAIGATWLVARAVPPFEPRRTSDPLQMSDPSLDLKRNLMQGSEETVISYTTDIPGGAYLKLATLPALSTAGFALSDVRVATGRMPSPPGDPAGEARTTTVTIDGFASEWLPVPYAPTSFDAPGEWGFALDTLDVMALSQPERTSASDGITYTVASLDVRPDAARIASATSTGGPDPELTLALPAELPQRVRDLAHEITAGATTAGAQAQALEAWLRSDRFTYSTALTTGVGDGLTTIDQFLFESPVGYCEQFAGAMAIMARELGIPTRMAVGFAPGELNGDTWEVTARDMHTWPELWLDGLGWVAFEPTPSAGGDADAGGEAPADPTGTAAPSAGATAEATPTPEPAEESPSAEPDPSPDESGDEVTWTWWPLVVGIVLVAALVAAALVAPRVLRARRRQVRLAGTGDPLDDTLAAWEEVRESAADARVPWPEGSPRYAAERLVASLGEDEAAVTALRSLAAAVERALYDRRENFDLPGRWADAVGSITAALHRQEPASPTDSSSARPRRAAR